MGDEEAQVPLGVVGRGAGKSALCEEEGRVSPPPPPVWQRITAWNVFFVLLYVLVGTHTPSLFITSSSSS